MRKALKKEKLPFQAVREEAAIYNIIMFEKINSLVSLEVIIFLDIYVKINFK
ncbi:hypothetical protein AB1J28_11125 [Lysinibacillus irui]|uniref:hypothetical protein n=2 Tax=Lysinibacillus TaxID=400634 RepID=UPI003D2BA6CB